MAKDDGGPAYPLQGKECVVHGMSLRDYFAGQAVTRIREPVTCQTDFSIIAVLTYHIADAMIAEKRRREAEEAKTDE